MRTSHLFALFLTTLFAPSAFAVDPAESCGWDGGVTTHFKPICEAPDCDANGVDYSFGCVYFKKIGADKVQLQFGNESFIDTEKKLKSGALDGLEYFDATPGDPFTMTYEIGKVVNKEKVPTTQATSTCGYKFTISPAGINAFRFETERKPSSGDKNKSSRENPRP